MPSFSSLFYLSTISIVFTASLTLSSYPDFPPISSSISSPPEFPPSPAPSPTPSPDISPLFPSPGGVPGDSSFPTIPSSPSPPNPDDMVVAPAPEFALPPAGSMPISGAFFVNSCGFPVVLAAFVMVKLSGLWW